MGLKTGDKSRHNRKRRKKLARRVEMRALRKLSEAAPTAKKSRPTGATDDASAKQATSAES